MAESKHSDTTTAHAPTLLPPARVERHMNPVLQDQDQNQEESAVKDQQQQHMIQRQEILIAELKQKRDELRSELYDIRESEQKLIEELSERNAEDRLESSQCSDSYLIETADHLRYLIDSFATVCSKDFKHRILPTMRSENTREAKYYPHLMSTAPALPTYLEILETSVGLARFLEAFVWKVLTTEVFGGFHWAGQTVSSSIVEIRRFLQRAEPGSTPSSHEQEIATWRWTLNTTQIVQNSLDGQSPEDLDIGSWKQGIVDSFLHITLGSPEDSMAEQLVDIIDLALNLDKKLSRQVTPLEWRYYNQEFLQRTDYQLDAGIMKVHDDDGVLALKRNQESKPPRVQLVVAPALVKRRDLTMDGVGVEDVLLKSIVHYT
ncbi:hypothetical protein QBC37DRAFT_27175 [Rhypophila decipiens]|uniref:Uncharacterized protein n=1 Tax=Rhypophila decipiens TaxID=261697 RepID=A0AAN7B7E3_9PEZI|nr:hypothetical protein QBC37DRAFT_27175 [Rhypophila decipiens]